jgi:hypothetical protein
MPAEDGLEPRSGALLISAGRIPNGSRSAGKRCIAPYRIRGDLDSLHVPANHAPSGPWQGVNHNLPRFWFHRRHLPRSPPRSIVTMLSVRRPDHVPHSGESQASPPDSEELSVGRLHSLELLLIAARRMKSQRVHHGCGTSDHHTVLGGVARQTGLRIFYQRRTRARRSC